ncbi:ATP-binding cassette domain-containing protein [Leminorella grimontii]|uniref:ATP-binding cassette domain-containing protein n=1 Tax=Leminorella grimontii TaxID=82981 RepID=UPI00322062A0
MLELKNITLLQGKHRWLRKTTFEPMLSDINLTLQRGELVALVGGSGEGKSLLLQSLLGLLPDAISAQGRILLDGHDVPHERLQELRGRVLGYIPQSVSALNPLIKTGRQIQRAAGLSGDMPCNDEIVERLKRYRLSPDLLNRYPLSLSGGMAKRVLVSCATLSQSRFILADEITAWLDERHAEVLMGHLKTLCEEGRGVLWVTHDLHLASRYADRIAVLHQGELKETLCARQLRSGGGSPWIQSLWRSLPEFDFFNEPEDNAVHAANA